jgi:hypothetical protein
MVLQFYIPVMSRYLNVNHVFNSMNTITYTQEDSEIIYNVHISVK